MNNYTKKCHVGWGMCTANLKELNGLFTARNVHEGLTVVGIQHLLSILFLGHA